METVFTRVLQGVYEDSVKISKTLLVRGLYEFYKASMENHED